MNNPGAPHQYCHGECSALPGFPSAANGKVLHTLLMTGGLLGLYLFPPNIFLAAIIYY